MTVQPTDHVRFQQRKPYVKEIKTSGAPLLEQHKDRNDVVTLNSLNDLSKEQVLQGKGNLVKITNAKNGTFDKTTVEVLSDLSKQNVIRTVTRISSYNEKEVRVTGFEIGDVTIVSKLDADSEEALAEWKKDNNFITTSKFTETILGKPISALE